MEEEMRELRDLVAQLRADNEKLRQDQSRAAPLSPMAGSSRGSSVPPADQSASGGEAREEIRHRPAAERGDPEKIYLILQELYGCSQSYVALQEAFFSRRQRDGETLLEFSLALMGLLEKVKQKSPTTMLNAEVLLRDQFVEYVCDVSLRRELKQFVRRQPNSTLLEVRSEAIRWEREGMPGGARGRSLSVPAAHGFQFEVHGDGGVKNQATLHGNVGGNASCPSRLCVLTLMQQVGKGGSRGLLRRKN
ncbi:hypothetical protein F2P79_024503 [Pimephales promelas]|nr:hypothetical protein F2P79_024503 [Pimephales promelas]